MSFSWPLFWVGNTSECEMVNMSNLEVLWAKLDLSSKEEQEMDFSEDWGSL